MWGIIPAAGAGTRIQPLAFSKELLPIYDRGDSALSHPRAVSDYLIERFVVAGADRICFVIAPGKSDILEYYGATAHSATLFYSVQPKPFGLCDAIFRALPVICMDEPVLIGLPDTIWFPKSGLKPLPDDQLSALLFPVPRPEYFDAVVLDECNRIVEIQVKHPSPSSNLIWGAFKMPGQILLELHELWQAREQRDEFLGTLINAWLHKGNVAFGVATGTDYFDVGTIDGYLSAMQALKDILPPLQTSILKTA